MTEHSNCENYFIVYSIGLFNLEKGSNVHDIIFSLPFCRHPAEAEDNFIEN